MNRRGFLGLLAAAIGTASAGITLAPASTPGRRKVHARHLYQFSIDRPWSPAFEHRIDVKFMGPSGIEQWGVDFITQNEKADVTRELAPSLAALNNHIKSMGYEVGEIHTYSISEWMSNSEARRKWDAVRIG